MLLNIFLEKAAQYAAEKKAMETVNAASPAPASASTENQSSEPTEPKVATPVATTTNEKSAEQSQAENAGAAKTPEQIQAEAKALATAKIEAEAQEKARKERERIQKEAFENIEYPEYLKENNPQNNGQQKTETKEGEKTQAEEAVIPQKYLEYEKLFENPLVKTFAEYIQSGGNDLNEFARKTGFVAVEKLTPEELYRMDAQARGLQGDELEDEVRANLENYESLTRRAKDKELSELRNEVSKAVNEKTKTFSAELKEAKLKQEQAEAKIREQIKAITDAADKELSSFLASAKGKNRDGLILDDNIIAVLKDEAPKYAIPKMDDKGNLIGFDVQTGIDFALYKNFKTKILKENFDAGVVLGYTKARKERSRPSENITQSGVTSVADTYEIAKKQFLKN